ncbi:DUF3017 domain-containing protein [Georgenia yuyongxinii]|uniref:DUF3017 domain-containing protein n=1 Tax=Georgenia yuyongxinii TaxID=2589797 RepID=A0A5B8C8R4_9MICO|nr:DUF3017 domain-containing protein [Georgenia yuyongxinii]QDC25785.1 DUF3017 domain-containing protein [Georgenia yuyongxinii]
MSSTRGVRIGIMAVLVLAIAAVCVLSVTVSARAGVTALAALLAGCAVLRAAAPETVMPAVRSRTADVVVLLVGAVALAYLSPWGDALPTDA